MTDRQNFNLSHFDQMQMRCITSFRRKIVMRNYDETIGFLEYNLKGIEKNCSNKILYANVIMQSSLIKMGSPNHRKRRIKGPAVLTKLFSFVQFQNPITRLLGFIV